MIMAITKVPKMMRKAPAMAWMTTSGGSQIAVEDPTDDDEQHDHQDEQGRRDDDVGRSVSLHAVRALMKSVSSCPISIAEPDWNTPASSMFSQQTDTAPRASNTA